MSPKQFWTLSLLAPSPLTALYFYSLIQPNQYILPLVAILSVAAFAAGRWDKKWYYPMSWSAATLFLLALLILGIAIAIWSPWLGSISLLAFATSFLASHNEQIPSSKRRRLKQRSLTYLSIPLIVVPQLPSNWESSFYTVYSDYVVKLSGLWLDALNTPHFKEGPTLELSHHRFMITQLGGADSPLRAMVLISLLIFAWSARPILLAPIYGLVGILLAGLLQTVRITTIATVADKLEFDFTVGNNLQMLHWLSLLAVTFLFYSFDALLMLIFAPVDSDSIRVSESGRRNPFKILWNRLLRRSKSSSRLQKEQSSKMPYFILVPLSIVLAISFGLQIVFSLT